MEILSAGTIQLSNQECLQILKEVKTDHCVKKGQKNKRKNDRLLTLVLETIKYLEDSPAGLQEQSHLQEFITHLQTFCQEENCLLTKKEIIHLVNIRPQTPVEIQLLIEDSEERLSEEQVERIIEIIGLYIPGPEEEQIENGEDLENGEVEETGDGSGVQEDGSGVQEDGSGIQEEDRQNIPDQQPMDDTENS